LRCVWSGWGGVGRKERAGMGTLGDGRPLTRLIGNGRTGQSAQVGGLARGGKGEEGGGPTARRDSRARAGLRGVAEARGTGCDMRGCSPEGNESRGPCLGNPVTTRERFRVHVLQGPTGKI